MNDLEKLDGNGWRSMIGEGARCILEVGAHDGSDTAILLWAFPRAMIYCWEPDPRPLARFWNNVRQAGNSAFRRVVLSRNAVADQSGLTKVWYASHGNMNGDPCAKDFPPEMQQDWDASGSIMRPTGHVGFPRWLGFIEEGTTTTIALDDWFRREPRPSPIDLLWADTQGAELLVMKGARQMLQHTRYVYVEVHDITITPRHKAPAELYEGQPTYRQLCDTLPGWTVLGLYNKDSLLFRNDNLA